MDMQIDHDIDREIIPAIWMVVDEEDWSGVNDCGAIFKPVDPIDAYRLIDDIDWPIECCS